MSDFLGPCPDHILNETILRCLKEMRGHTTQDKMTICFNLVSRILRLFCICGKKDEILGFLETINQDLIDQVEESFHDR